jgi:hypothetical protein
MSGPRYGGRGRSKCRIRNESIIDEVRNRFKLAHRQTAACARRATALGASEAAGRADRLALPFELCRARAPAAAAAQRLADMRRSAGRPRRPIRRCRSRRPSTIWWPARREHAGSMRGQVQWSCSPPVVARLNAADAAWAVAGWVGQGYIHVVDGVMGQRLHKSKGRQLPPAAAHPSNLFERPVRILCIQVINSYKSGSKCEIRIWFRRPSAACSKCQKFEFNVSARYI